MKRKKLKNKDFEHRDNVLMIEIQNLKHVTDSMFITLVKYIEMNNDKDRLMKYMEKDNKEAEDVQTELQKPSS